jgi:cardiolipin synthase A/B
MWTIAATIAVTLVIVVIVINFHTPEKKIQHQVQHLYGEVDPQFEREMGFAGTRDPARQQNHCTAKWR